MTPATARRIGGWTCLALGKIGSLLLLWQFIVMAEPGPRAAQDTPVLLAFAPLALMTLGMVVIGLWLLLRNDPA